MNYLSNFSEKLKSLMMDRDLSVSDFAKDIGFYGANVYDYLNKAVLPNVFTLVKIADYFHCTTDYLLGLDDENLSDVFYEYKPFPQQLGAIKNYCKKSEYYLIKKSGISDAVFYSWKRGAHVPSVENLIKLAEAAECSLDFVLGRAKV